MLNITVNVALQRPAVQSGTYSNAVASLAVDGDLTTKSCTVAAPEPWLSIDLGAPMNVGRVCVTNDKNPNYGKLRQLLRPCNNYPNILSPPIAFTVVYHKPDRQ